MSSHSLSVDESRSKNRVSDIRNTEHRNTEHRNAENCDAGNRYSSISATQRIGRIAGVVFGVATQALFLWTVVFLFLFLRYGGWCEYQGWWVADTALAVLFAVPHSILLAPPTSKYLRQWIPAGLLGCVHCMVSCVTLLLMFRFWGKSTVEVWHATGWAETAMLVGFYGSWVALLYSLYWTGFGYQTGLTQWWYWFRKSPPPQRAFVTTGAFRYMRHPVYMSFLGLIWFTPVMTLDHAILTGVWTLYIYAGSYFKDRRLLRFIGEPYLEYGKRISGFPIIGFGSLRRFR
jgi:protein-S-isoprenylcysteine O-methyltransferase Ste14